MLKKSELDNVLLEKAGIFWSQFRYVCDFFYNAVICSIIVFGSVSWGGSISKFDRGRLEKIVKKKAGHVVGMPFDSFKTLYEKQLFKKLM